MGRLVEKKYNLLVRDESTGCNNILSCIRRVKGLGWVTQDSVL